MKRLISFIAIVAALVLGSTIDGSAQQTLTNENGYKYHQAYYDLQLNGELGVKGGFSSFFDPDLIMVVGDTAAVADTSKDAILDIRSTDRGVLLPRLTAAQRAAIYSPPEGLLVFDTDSNKLCWFTGSLWKCAIVPADP